MEQRKTAPLTTLWQCNIPDDDLFKIFLSAGLKEKAYPFLACFLKTSQKTLGVSVSSLLARASCNHLAACAPASGMKDLYF